MEKNYKDIIIKERRLLELKMSKLDYVLQTIPCDIIDVALIKLQLSHMTDYRDVLTARLKR